MNKELMLVALWFSGAVWAEAATTVDKTQQICSNAAGLFAAGQYDKAYDSLLPYWPLPKEEIQNLGYQTKSQLGMVGERFGKSIEAEYVQTVTAGNSMVRQIYLIKHEKHALKFSCVFYKPKDQWLINTILWDDKPHTLVGVGG